MKLIGILLVLNSIALTSWWITTQGTQRGTVLVICSIAVFAGLALILQDRITELTIKGVGTIKSATQQATADAKTVAELKDRVENQSATVDLVAKQATKAKELSEQVADQSKRAEEKLSKFDNTIKDANITLQELKSATDFTMTVVAAQNDDRKAFDKLQQLANDKKHPFSAKAGQAWNTIFEDHNKPYSVSGFTVPWPAGFDPSKLSLVDLTQQYNGAPTQIKPALLEHIWNRNDIAQFDRLQFMMNVMKTDSSLTAAEYAGRHFTTGTGQKIKPLAVEYLSKWWDEHQQEFKGK